MRPRTGGVDPRGAVAIDETEDALGAAQSVERAIAEQSVDEERAGGADLGRALATPGRGLHQEVDFLGWQVRGQRPALARARAAMGGDQGVVVEQLDLAPGGADPEPHADEAMRRRVIGAIEDDVA